MYVKINKNRSISVDFVWIIFTGWIHSILKIVSSLGQPLWIQSTWFSALILLFLTSPEASASISSDNWDKAGPTLLLSSPPPLVCRVCKIWSLGRFQDVRVAIQSIRAPKTTRRSPRTLTKTASGGESLYFGLFLSVSKKKTLKPATYYHCMSALEINTLSQDFTLLLLLLFLYLQAKNEFLSNAHECHSYNAGKD